MSDRKRTLDIFWFIPVSGDGSYLGSDVGHRPADFHYLKQIAQAADRLGYGGVLIPVGAHCDEPWITAAALATHTERLRFLAALRPALGSPTHFARQAAALDRISNGRFLVNLVAGGDTKELAGDGIFLGHDERYAQASEFLKVFNDLTAGKTVDFEGRYLKVRGARQLYPPVQKSHSDLVRRLVRSGASISPRRRPTFTSPGVSRCRRWRKRLPRFARERLHTDARCDLACACISSSAKQTVKPGALRTN